LRSFLVSVALVVTFLMSSSKKHDSRLHILDMRNARGHASQHDPALSP
jgi:hypothetical protein